jgi:hypothetical protein
MEQSNPTTLTEGAQQRLADSATQQPVSEQRTSLRKILSSESFIEKVALLLITVIISGLAIPLVLAYYNNSALERQKNSDFARTRAEAVSAAQTKLVEDLSSTIFSYETLALDASWYNTATGKDVDLAAKAYDRYAANTVDLISKWRALQARAKTLASPAISQKIAAFQIRMFAQQDTPMVVLHRKGGTEEQWAAQHRKNEEMLAEADSLIAEIMTDLGLTKSTSPSAYYLTPSAK